MVMQWQNVPIQFNNGLNEKTDDKQVGVGQWLTLDNLEMWKSGRFKKRRGLTQGSNLGGTALVESPTSTPMAVPTTSLFVENVYDTGVKTDTAPGNTAWTSVATVSFNQAGVMSCIYGSKLTIDTVTLRWRKYNSDYTVSIDNEIGTVYVSRSSIKRSQWCGVSNTTSAREPVTVFVSYWSPTGKADIVVFVGRTGYVDATDIDAGRLCAVGYGNYVYFAYYDSTAGNTKIKRFNLSNNTFDKTVTVAAVAQSLAINVSANGQTVYVAVDTQVKHYDSELNFIANGLSAPSTSYVTHVSSSGIVVSVLGENIYIDSSLGRSDIKSTKPAQMPIFMFGGSEYLFITAPWPGADTTPWASGYMMIKLDPAAFVASGIEIAAHFFYSQPCYAIGYSGFYDNKLVVPTTSSLKVLEWSKTGRRSTAINMFGDIVFQNANIANRVGAFNGSTAYLPYGIPYAPTISEVSRGSNTTDYVVGTYTFSAVLKHTLPSGRVAYSAPSMPISYVLGISNKSINVTVVIPDWENARQANMSLSLYVIKPGSTSYEVVADNLPVLNSQIVESSTVVFGAPTIYTQGGILEDLPPPLTRGTISAAKNRLWCMSAEAPEVRFSDLFYPGEVPQFVEAFSLQLIPNGGAGITVRELDGKVIVLQKYCVSATYGDGPDFTGANPFPPLQLIARDIGAIEGNSVVATNEGIFFLSSKGLWIISRSLTVEFIGAPVEDSATNIIAAAKLADKEQIWFFSSTRAFIYDAFHKIWTTSTFGNITISDARVISGVLHILATTGVDYTLDAAATNDAGTAITVTAKTGWISLAGLKGFQRIRRIMFLADQVSSTNMTVKLRYDFVPTDAETFTINSATIVDAGNNVQWVMRPARQKCECIQLEFTTQSAGGTLDISNIAIETGMKSGLNRLPVSKKIGGN